VIFELLFVVFVIYLKGNWILGSFKKKVLLRIDSHSSGYRIGYADKNACSIARDSVGSYVIRNQYLYRVRKMVAVS